MGKAGRLTKEDWDGLEPLLAEADKATHQRFMSSPEAKALLGEEQDRSPGYLLLQRLKETNDQGAVRLFRAMEMYHHELTRADIAAAFLHGKEVGQAGAKES